MSLLVIVQSRQRPEKLAEMLASYEDTKADDKTDIVIYLDSDDPKLNEYKLEGYNVEIGERKNLNSVSMHFINQYPNYDYYAEINDDMVFRTDYWDLIMMETIQDNGGWGIAYGDDLLMSRKKRQPSQMVISANIIKTLGYIAPPTLKHLYRDVYWKKLGEATSTLLFCPDVIIEHKHWSSGKVEIDDTYKQVAETLQEEHKRWQEYQETSLQSDIDKINKARQ
jgi:hypothetical protein